MPEQLPKYILFAALGLILLGLLLSVAQIISVLGEFDKTIDQANALTGGQQAGQLLAAFGVKSLPSLVCCSRHSLSACHRK